MSAPDAGGDAAAARAYEQAATSLLCDCGCAPQSIKECACGRAEELRASLKNDARTGKSGDAIVASYVARHGQKILVSPPASGFNLIAWTGPAVGLVVAALAITLMIRRWRRASVAGAGETAGPAPAAGDDAYLARLRREIEDLR
jgi:cytochrome c-type biogenesis protein CcmH